MTARGDDKRTPPSFAPPGERRQHLELALTVALLALLIFAAFVVLRPFITAVLWSVVLVVATWRGYQRLEVLLGGRRRLAALLATLILAVILVVPLLLIAGRLAEALARVASHLRVFVEQGLEPPVWLGEVPLVGHYLLSEWHRLLSDDAALQRLIGTEIRPLILWLLGAFATLGTGMLQVALAVFCTPFFYLGGPGAARRGRDMLRHLAGDRADELITVAHLTLRGVVVGVLGAAAAQGLLAGLGFWVAGLPEATLLGIATFFAGIIPNVAFLVLLPATVWAFYELGTAWGIGLLVWNFGIVGQIDSVIRPMVIARGTRMPLLLMLFGVIGGLGAFGFLGIFLGPTLLALLYTLIRDWSPEETDC
ncbi:MAG TPA: AI-2E family transporter [Acetobacteraceae bacterium]|nr:AI-2E family transporter [Acetobacteraceae bacterium]